MRCADRENSLARRATVDRDGPHLLQKRVAFRFATVLKRGRDVETGRILHRLVHPEMSRTLRSFEGHFLGRPVENAAAIKRNLLRQEPRSRKSDGSQQYETIGELTFLFKLLDSFTRHHREITNTWETIDCILRITRTLNLRGRAEEEQVVRFIHMFILPVISDLASAQ